MPCWAGSPGRITISTLCWPLTICLGWWRLVRNGFVIEEEELGRVVLGHADQGRIDLHPVTFDAHGNAVQVQPAAPPVLYRRGGLVTGSIHGRAVGCVAADVQLCARLGHDRSAKHRQDVVALCAAFALQIPTGWDEA